MIYVDPFAGGQLGDYIPKPMRIPLTTNDPKQFRMAQGGSVDVFWYPQTWEDIVDLLQKG